MDIHETLAKLTRHYKFKEWHEKNKDYFLAHGFVMLDEQNKDTWQIGFYNKDKERMVTFIITGDEIDKTEDQEILKSEGEIQPLKVDEVKMSVEEALKIAQECYDENYKGEVLLKHFFIIQHIEGSTMFNVTYFTQSLSTINIKIDAQDGKILKHNKQKLAEFT